MSGTLEAIWIKRAHHGPMDPVSRAQLRQGHGLVGNANQGGKRQVTIIDRRSWDAVVGELGRDVDPATRRANLLVGGLSLENSRGRTLKVGPVRVRIYGETRPCRLMEEQEPGLQRALSSEWRGGAFGEVLDDGEIAVGAPVAWSEEEPMAATATGRAKSLDVNKVVPIINVSDMAKSFSWFEKMGWHLGWQWGDPPDFGGVENGKAEIFLCLDGQGGRGSSGSWLTWWLATPEDVDAAYRRAVEQGVEVMQEPMDRPWNLREFTVRHPDGHQFRIGAPLPEADEE